MRSQRIIFRSFSVLLTLFILMCSASSYAYVSPVCMQHFSNAGIIAGDNTFSCRLRCTSANTGTDFECPNQCNDYCSGNLLNPWSAENDGEPGCGGATAGNPIAVTTGNKYQVETDFVDVINDPAQLPLQIVRYYNSSPQVHYKSSFGLKWRNEYDRYVVAHLTNNTQQPTAPKYVDLYRHDGKVSKLYLTSPVLREGEVNPLDFLGQAGQIYAGDFTYTAGTYFLFSGANPQAYARVTVSSSGTPTGYQYVDYQAGLRETYNAAGFVTLIERINGTGSIAINYRTNNTIETATSSYGRQLTYTYDASGRVDTIQSPDGRIYRYTYLSTGSKMLSFVIFPDDTIDSNDNTRKQYLYSNSSITTALTGIIDEEGKQYATFGYDVYGRANYSSHAGGAGEVSLEYDAPAVGQTTVTYKTSADRSNKAIFHFEDVNGFKRITQIEGQAGSNCAASNSTITYSNGSAASIVDGNDYSTLIAHPQGFATELKQGYDYAGNPLPESREIVTDWNREIGMPDFVTLPGRTIDFEYDPVSSRLSSIVETDITNNVLPYSTFGKKASWTYGYTFHDVDRKRVKNITIDGPRLDVADIVQIEFNDSGWITRVTNQLNQITSITAHDSAGRPATISAPNGQTISLTYTHRGWLDTRSLTVDGRATVIDYDYYRNGLLSKITAEDSSFLSFSYDDAQRLKTITNRLGERVEFSLDNLGNPVLESRFDASSTLAAQIEREFDDLGRLWKLIGVESQESMVVHYDDANNPTEYLNQELKAVSLSYDALNRVKTVADRMMNRATFEYDGQNNIIQITNGRDHSTQYIYDGFNNLVYVNDPSQGSITYWYDDAGNLIRETNARGITKSYTYDVASRVRTATFSGDASQNLVFHYDETNTFSESNRGIGYLTRIEQANGNHIGYVFDGRGRITKHISFVNGNRYDVAYSFDNVGRIATITHPGGRIVEYHRDGMGQTTSVTTSASSTAPVETIASNIKHAPFGPMTSLTFGNGVVYERAVDQHYRSDYIKAGNLYDVDTVYDQKGNITDSNDRIEPAKSEEFTYDDGDKLDYATGTYGSFDYGYDEVFNRISQVKTGSNAFSESYNLKTANNQLNNIARNVAGSTTSTPLIYNPAGSVTTQGAFTYVMNDQEQISQIREGANIIGSYTYNALGQRIEKTTPRNAGFDRQFVYDLSGQLLSEQNLAADPRQEFVYLDGLLIAVIDAGLDTKVVDVGIAMKGVNQGTALAFEATITNSGPDAAANTTVSFTIPAEMGAYSTATASLGNCSISPQWVTCQLGALSSAGTATIQVRGTVNTATYKKEMVKGSVTNDIFDSNAANNTADLGGCFIATAAYGSYQHQYLNILRGFRDKFLITNPVGSTFVDFYYSHSSQLADWIRDREDARAVVRAVLLPAIGFAWWMQADIGEQVLWLAIILLGVGVLCASVKILLSVSLKKLITGLTAFAYLITTSLWASETVYVVADHLGTPKVMMDATKQPVWKADYEPFGRANVVVSTIQNQIRFAGQYHDVESGLHYNYFRYYHPGMGSYLQADPIGLSGGPNVYSYVGGNPVQRTDPYGLFWVGAAVAAIEGAAVGGVVGAAVSAMGGCFSGADVVNGMLTGAAFGGLGYLAAMGINGRLFIDSGVLKVLVRGGMIPSSRKARN